MVKVQQSSEEYARLDALLRELCEKHNLKLFDDIFLDRGRGDRKTHLARVETLVTSNGEIRFFDDRATDFVQELGAALESEFEVSEAILIRDKPPAA
ncbi:MAG: hypothetical protein QGF67_19690 [Lentisphaeria bacterium]|nr:hypothetical protein [Lentisphaeria bacterium]